MMPISNENRCPLKRQPKQLNKPVLADGISHVLNKKELSEAHTQKNNNSELINLSATAQYLDGQNYNFGSVFHLREIQVFILDHQ